MITPQELRDVPLFQGLHPEELQKVAEVCEEQNYKKGEVVFYQDSKVPTVYMLMNGELEVESETRDYEDFIPVQKIEPKEIFGELCFVDNTPRSATVKCLTDAQMITFSRNHFDALVKTDEHIGRIVMENLSKIVSARLRDTTSRLRDILSRFPSKVIERKTKETIRGILDAIWQMKGI